MRSATWGNPVYKVGQTSSGIFVSLYRETSRNSLGVIHAVPDFIWASWDGIKFNTPFNCSVDLHESEVYTTEQLDALFEQHSTKLHPAMTL